MTDTQLRRQARAYEEMMVWRMLAAHALSPMTHFCQACGLAEAAILQSREPIPCERGFGQLAEKPTTKNRR